MRRVLAYINLMRPANILTAIADIMFGFAASGMAIEFIYEDRPWFKIHEINSLYWLITSTVGLYGGGVVFNDVFDAKIDREERPERPIPSGKASILGASILGIILLLVGIYSAYQVSIISTIIAFTIALLALTYDIYSKHQSFLGPLNMGACRSGNLLLGISVVPSVISQLWFLGLIPILYVGAITLISRGEVYGASKKMIENGLIIYAMMLLGILNLGLLDKFSLWNSMPFLGLFLLATIPSWISALRTGRADNIKRAVKTGVISLIILDASLAAGFAGYEFGLLILILLPLSIIIGKGFTVT